MCRLVFHFLVIVNLNPSRRTNLLDMKETQQRRNHAFIQRRRHAFVDIREHLGRFLVVIQLFDSINQFHIFTGDVNKGMILSSVKPIQRLAWDNLVIHHGLDTHSNTYIFMLSEVSHECVALMCGPIWLPDMAGWLCMAEPLTSTIFTLGFAILLVISHFGRISIQWPHWGWNTNTTHVIFRIRCNPWL